MTTTLRITRFTVDNSSDCSYKVDKIDTVGKKTITIESLDCSNANELNTLLNSYPNAIREYTN